MFYYVVTTNLRAYGQHPRITFRRPAIASASSPCCRWCLPLESCWRRCLEDSKERSQREMPRQKPSARCFFPHGFLMVFSWFSHGFSLVFSWFSHDFSMVLPWFSHGFANGFLLFLSNRWRPQSHLSTGFTLDRIQCAAFLLEIFLCDSGASLGFHGNLCCTAFSGKLSRWRTAKLLGLDSDHINWIWCSMKWQ